MLERTIERLQGELSCAVKDEEEREQIKSEVSWKFFYKLKEKHCDVVKCIWMKRVVLAQNSDWMNHIWNFFFLLFIYVISSSSSSNI